MIELIESPFILRKATGHCSIRFKSPELSRIKLPGSLEKAALKRQLHFRMGRYCAKHALSMDGYPHGDFEIQICRDSGAPLWPHGYVGSITHVEGFAASVVARTSILKGIGIDTESIMDKSQAEKVCPEIMTREELRACQEALSEWSYEKVVTLCFSAKESVYKCLSPHAERSFGFRSIEILRIEAAQQIFHAKLLHFGLLKGSFQFSGGLVHTALELPAG